MATLCLSAVSGPLSVVRRSCASASSPPRTSDYGQRTSSCSEQDSNLQHRDSRSRASAGWATRALARLSQWMPEGLEPSSPGCKPGVLPLDDGPKLFHVLREGLEPS